MGRIRYGWAALRENRRSGLALLIALCASALLLSLTLGLIYAASIPVARANRKLQQERCHVLVGSFAAVVDTELRKYTAEAVGLDWEEPVWDDTANRVAAEGSFYSQVNAVLEDCDRTGCGFEAPISLKLDDGDPDGPYATVLEDGVRVKVGLPLNPAGADLQEKEGGHGANCPGAAA